MMYSSFPLNRTQSLAVLSFKKIKLHALQDLQRSALTEVYKFLPLPDKRLCLETQPLAMPE